MMTLTSPPTGESHVKGNGSGSKAGRGTFESRPAGGRVACNSCSGGLCDAPLAAGALDGKV